MHVDALADTVRAAPARLRGSRLVCIDGRAGTGKTLLAAELAVACAADGPVTTIHMDDLYEGWSGLPTVAEVVIDSLMKPWTAGRAAQLAVWHWRGNRRLDAVPVDLTPVVLLEGVGSWSRRYDDMVSTLVWLECDEPTRRRRAIQRDGSSLGQHWDGWAADERLLYGREQTALQADVVIDTSVQCATPLP